MCRIEQLFLLAIVGSSGLMRLAQCENATTKAGQPECHHPFQIIKNGCYYISENKLNFDEAVDYCSNLDFGPLYDVHLAMFGYDLGDDEALLNTVAENNAPYFIGGKSEDGTDWHWIDNREISYYSLFWDNVEPNEINNKCMAIEKNVHSQDYGRAYAYDHDCTDNLQFICQVSQCPSKFIKLGNQCYLQSWTVGIPYMDWSDARDYCTSLAMPEGYHADLAILEMDGEEDTLMKDLVMNQTNAWVGASRTKGCLYRWVDGSFLSSDSVYWNYDQPSSCDYIDDKVEIFSPSYWNRPAFFIHHGSHRYGFICQMFPDL